MSLDISSVVLGMGVALGLYMTLWVITTGHGEGDTPIEIVKRGLERDPIE